MPIICRYRCVQAVVGAVFILLVAHQYPARAQNVETLTEEKPIGLNGAITLSSSLYGASGIPGRHTPFTWMIEGSPTISLYGIQIPFTIILSEQERSFRQPFNQFGISPTYKSLTAHLGYRSLNFSRYSLAGMTFLGGGFDFKPSILRLAGMYGRLQRAVEEDTTRFDIEPAYKRFGYAGKIGIGSEREFIDLTVLYAEDDSNSLRTVPLRSFLYPAENLVLGLNTRVAIIEQLWFEADGGLSLYTRDTRSPLVAQDDIPQFFAKLVDIRESTSLTAALNAALSLRLPSFQVRLGYERIEPDYKSMGAYYFTTDIEQWTVAPTVLLLENKLRISGSVGIQHDNLLDNRLATTNRFIGSGSVGYQPSQKFGIDLQVSNYATSQSAASPRFDESRRAENLSQSISLAPRLLFQETDLNQLLSLVAAYQRYDDRSALTNDLADSRAITTSLNYNRIYTTAGSTVGGAVIFSTSSTGPASTRVLGGSVTGSLSFLEKNLSLMGSLGVTNSKVSTLASGSTTINQTVVGSYRLTENDIVNLSVYASQSGGYETAIGTHVSGFAETTATLAFTHTFNY